MGPKRKIHPTNHNGFSKKIAIDTSNIRAVVSFFEASENVTDEEFKIFTAPLLSDKHDLYGLSWIPKIAHTERKIFEKSIQLQGYESFTIKSNIHNNLEESPYQPIYFPISYVRPYEQNKMAHGFDVYNIDNEHGIKRRQILDEARDIGAPMATSRFPIVQQQDQYGFIIYVPVYNKRNLTTLDDRRKHHIGYIGGIFTIPNLVQTLAQKALEYESHVILKEIQDDGSPPKILYDSRTPDGKESSEYKYDVTPSSHHNAIFDVAGKTWQISIFPFNPVPEIESTKTLWFYVLWGIVFNMFLMIVLTLITARNDYIESLVKERTSDLRQANEELEEFAYRTSHDLRSPLLSCMKLCDLATRYIRDGKADQAIQAISISTSSLKKLEQLINDISSLTEAKNLEEDKQIVNIDILIMESLEKISHMDGFQDVDIIKDLSYDDYLFVRRRRIQSIVENLISNAVKYRDMSKTKPYIKITTKSDDDYFVFSVQDNGLGIPEQNQKQLFTMFKRFHPKVSVGSGLGLYMIKKSAKILQGTIIYENTNNGSKFTLRIPIENTYQDN